MISTRLCLHDGSTHALDAKVLLKLMLKADHDKVITKEIRKKLQMLLDDFIESYYYSSIGLRLDFMDIHVDYGDTVHIIQNLFDEALYGEMSKFTQLDKVDFEGWNVAGFIEDLFETGEGYSLMLRDQIVSSEKDGISVVHFLTKPDDKICAELFEEIKQGLMLINDAMDEYGVLTVTDFLNRDAVKYSELYAKMPHSLINHRGLKTVIADEFGGLGIIKKLRLAFGDGWALSVLEHDRFTRFRWGGFINHVDYIEQLKAIVEYPYEVVPFGIRRDLELIIEYQMQYGFYLANASKQ